jgi:predicted esterase
VLHGAGGAAARMVAPVQALAERHGLVLLGVDSRGRTWDAVLGGYGPDVAFVERALARAARLVAVDRRRLGIAGFSDGASYALSLGRINGDLFRRIAAFSPGFVAPGRARGQPRILVTHGRQDAVLAIDRTSRRVVPALRAEGYAVDYREFDGGHVIPAEVLEAGVEWLAG